MWKKIEWKNIIRGMMMGVTELVPGVSSGTLAFILGIYDRLIVAISEFFSKDWKKHLLFLAPLLIGMGISLKAFSTVVTYLMENYKQPTQFLFLGLIIGILPLLYRESDMKKSFNVKHYIIMIIAIIPVVLLEINRGPESDTILVMDNIGTFVYIFLSGWLASMAMILPGISGSLVLVILGTYVTATTALKDLNVPIIIVFGLGVLLGVILCSKIIKHLLYTYPKGTYATIIGLVLGSIYAVYPGISNSLWVNITSILSFLIGLFIVQFIGRKNKSMKM
ncbi:DUF368 domain-containing protein [Sutcliffiella cohnii]